MITCDDITCVKRTLAGDTDAFSTLVERYRSLVFSLIIRIVRHRHDAEDLSQDVFVKAYTSLHNFRGDAQFSTWLCRIAYTTAISHTRRQRPDRADIEIQHDACIDNSNAQREDLLQQLQRSLEQLPTGDAVLIELFYRHNKPVDEIASITGLSVSNVKVRLYRIRKKLHDEIKFES